MESTLLTIAILLALLIALLAIPLSISFSISRKQELQAHARFRWLFGLVKFSARVPRETKPIKQENKPLTEKSRPKKSRSYKSRNNTHGVITLFKQSKFRRHIINYIKDMLRACHAQNLYLRLCIGLGDPADTGVLWAVMGPLSAMMNNLKSIQLEIEPEFIDSVVDFESHGHFRFIPLQFIALTIIFVLSPTTIQAWRRMRQIN